MKSRKDVIPTATDRRASQERMPEAEADRKNSRPTGPHDTNKYWNRNEKKYKACTNEASTSVLVEDDQ